MIFGINTTRDISKLSYNDFEISLVAFMPNITTNHAITSVLLNHAITYYLYHGCEVFNRNL